MVQTEVLNMQDGAMTPKPERRNIFGGTHTEQYHIFKSTRNLCS